MINNNNNRFQFWIFLGFLFTIMPIAITLWWIKGLSTPETTLLFVFKSVISKGELLLVCLSLLGANFGDLLKDECQNTKVKITLFSLTFILCIFSIFSYGVINTSPTFDKDYSFNTSITVFILSALICVVSILTPRK